MSLLCNLNCPVGLSPVDYVDPCDLVRRRAGQSCIVFVKCDYQFTDVRDPAEWTSAIGSGDVLVLGHQGSKWSLPEPSVTNYTDGCGEEIEIQRAYSIPFETTVVSLDSSDDLFFKRLSSGSSEWRVMLFTCDGKSYGSDDYFNDLVSSGAPTGTVVGSSPGIDFSFEVPPYEEYADNTETLVFWKFTISIKKRGQLCGFWLDGVPAVVCP